MPERAAPAGLSAIWHTIVALVVRFFGRLRRLLSLYPSLPVAPLAGGGFADGLMAPTEEEAVARAAALQFPPGFLFGSATAAYQVEGGLDNCNWREWEQRGKRADGHPTVEGGRGAGEACDMWNRFEEDLVHMKALGLAVYRFSVEWSRVEPEEGQFDDAALERYRGWCVQLREAGIEPMVTLHHFTEPAWFCKKGGWEVRENVANFRRFTERVVASLGPLVSCWCTTNEMNGYAVCGWLAGVHPPGKQDDLKGLLRVIRHLLLAHREAAAAIRAGSASLPRAPSVLMALNHIWFTTDSWSPLANATVLVLNVPSIRLAPPLETPPSLSPRADPRPPLSTRSDPEAPSAGHLQLLHPRRARHRPLPQLPAPLRRLGVRVRLARRPPLPRGQRRPARRQPLLPLSRLVGGRVRVGRAAEPVGPLPQAGRGPAVNSVSSHLHL